ncbi:MAG: hypothetical protein FE037_00565 [Thermoplasmata archaeon]|nr:MAG: hypothetical protein FE037_00565 [Thermoplasmata archaeon]
MKNYDHIYHGVKRGRIKLLGTVVFVILFTSIAGCFGQGDSDGDGLSDGIETAGWDVIIFYVDGTEKEIHVTSDPHKKDTDGDGLDDYEEFQHLGILNPSKADTDDDGLNDYEELKTYGTKPNKQDSEIWPDGLMDGIEVHGWNITARGETKKVYSNPELYDTDGDGLSDYQEWLNGTDPSSDDTDMDGVTDPSDISPLTDVKMVLRVKRFTLSSSYSGDAKPYLYIRPEGGEPVRSDFLGVVKAGETVNFSDFVEIIDVNDYKNLYPLVIEITAFDNNSQEVIHEYVPGYGYIDAAMDKTLRIYGGNETISFNFDATDMEREISISGYDASIIFTVSPEED